MNRINVALATTTALGLTMGALAADSPGVTTLTAGAAPGTPLVAPSTTRLLPEQFFGAEVKREEITRPGAVSVYAAWRNGKVWRVTVPQRRYRVTHANGATGEHVTEVNSNEEFAKQLPPHDRRLDRPPTAAELAEMDRIVAEGNPPPKS